MNESNFKVTHERQNLQLLQSYPFEKLAQLKQNGVPPSHLKAINLSLGEPQQATPDFIVNAMNATLTHGLGKYPSTRGSEALRSSIAYWLTHRFGLTTGSVDPNQHILPVNGPKVLIPNPFYQIYEGAALLTGAQPYFINCLESTQFQPNFTNIPEKVWKSCQLLYICSPNNPSGTVLDLSTFYAEIYADDLQPPVGLLQACMALGQSDYRRCIVFHSLSKRSNAPGLRAGFVAGDADIIAKFLLYRTYHGCAMPVAVQAASIAAWEDETHVATNRALYRQKFDAVMEILAPVMPVTRPPAGFYLWAQTPISDIQFARELFIQQNVTVLPGSFLSRTVNGINPGQNRIRIALVAALEECVEAVHRISSFIKTFCIEHTQNL